MVTRMHKAEELYRYRNSLNSEAADDVWAVATEIVRQFQESQTHPYIALLGCQLSMALIAAGCDDGDKVLKDIIDRNRSELLNMAIDFWDNAENARQDSVVREKIN